MRNLWKSAVAIVAISASLTTGLAGGSTVKAHDSSGLPSEVSQSYSVGSNWLWPTPMDGYPAFSGNGTETTNWAPPSNDGGSPIVGYSVKKTLYGYSNGWSTGPSVTTLEVPSSTRTTTLQWSWSSNLAAAGTYSGTYDGLICVAAINVNGIGPYVCPPLLPSPSPTVPSVTVFAQNSLTVSWTDGASRSFPQPTYTVTLQPSGKSCITTQLTCLISGLKATTGYAVTVTGNNPQGSGSSDSMFPVFPVQSNTFLATISNRVVSVNRTFSVVVTGLRDSESATIGIPGQSTQCSANPLGQCSVNLALHSSGVFTLLAVSGTQSNVQRVWAPLVKTPKAIAHGKSFSVSISHAPPKAQVVINTNDGRTIKATTNSAGGVSVAVKTTTRAFLKVNVSISGTAFGPYEVQVS